MLKYKRTDVVVYFTQKELEYRRVGCCWEVLLDGAWRLSKECEQIEAQYKKRTSLRNLIKRKNELSGDSSFYNRNSDSELTDIVKELINILGIGTYIDNTTIELLDKLDTGEIEVK